MIAVKDFVNICSQILDLLFTCLLDIRSANHLTTSNTETTTQASRDCQLEVAVSNTNRWPEKRKPCGPNLMWLKPTQSQQHLPAPHWSQQHSAAASLEHIPWAHRYLQSLPLCQSWLSQRAARTGLPWHLHCQGRRSCWFKGCILTSVKFVSTPCWSKLCLRLVWQKTMPSWSEDHRMKFLQSCPWMRQLKGQVCWQTKFEILPSFPIDLCMHDF